MKTTRIIIAENAFGYPVSVTSYNNKTRNGIMLFYADFRAVMRIVRWADAEGNREARTLLAKGKRK